MKGADLRWSKLMQAQLQGADLEPYINGFYSHPANLEKANLFQADLRGANLYQANLQEADMHSADIRGANLNSTNLSSANLDSVLINSKTSLIGAHYDMRTKFGQLKKGGTFCENTDWINAEAEEQRWRALGARRFGEKPTEDK